MAAFFKVLKRFKACKIFQNIKNWGEETFLIIWMVFTDLLNCKRQNKNKNNQSINKNIAISFL